MQIGALKKEEFKPHEAVKSFKEAGAIYKALGNNEGFANALFELAEVQAEMENCSEALQNYVMCIEYFTRAKNKIGEMDGYFGAADCYTIIEKPIFAIEYYNQGLRLANELKTGALIYEAFRGLSTSYSSLGKFEEALFYKDKYIAVQDSLHLVNSKEIANKSNTDQKQSARIQELEEQLLASQQTSNEILRILIISGSLIMLLLVAIIIGRFFYNKRAAEFSMADGSSEVSKSRGRRSRSFAGASEEMPTVEKKSRFSLSSKRKAASEKADSVEGAQKPPTAFAKNVRKSGSENPVIEQPKEIKHEKPVTKEKSKVAKKVKESKEQEKDSSPATGSKSAAHPRKYGTRRK